MNIMIWVTIAFIAGILTGGTELLSLEPLYVAAGLLIFFTLVCLIIHSRYSQMAVVSLFFIIGCIHMIHAAAVSQYDISRWAGAEIIVYGTVADVPQTMSLDENKVRVRYRLSVTSIDNGQYRELANGGMLFSVTQPVQEPVAHYGAHAAVRGKVLLPHSYSNPGLIDRVAALRRQGITARMAVKAGDAVFREQSGQLQWRTMIHERRDGIVGLIGKSMPSGNAAIMTGMLLGGYQGIKAETLDDFAATGIIHILSVSGTHVALVAGVMLWLGKRLGLGRGVTVLAAVLSVCLYSVLAGLSPPVLRSAVMGLAGLAAVAAGRERDTATALFLAALGILIHQPQLIYDISFQLTFGATTGIVLLYSRSLRFFSFLPDCLAGVAAVTLAAQLGVLPVVAWYFNTFSVVSLLANLIIVPVIECVVVLGLAAAVVNSAAGVAAAMLLVLCSLLIDGAVKMASWLAALPGGSIYLPSFGVWGGAAYYFLLAWLYGYLPHPIPSLPFIFQKRPKAVCGAAMAVIVAAGFIWLYPRPAYVHFIDVGQGDAILVTTPHRRAALIDTGGTFGDSTGFDIGRQVVLPYLKHYGVTELDYLMLTHGHQDHAGGSAAIAAAIPVKTIMLPREKYAQPVQALLHRAGNDTTVVPMYDRQTVVLDGMLLEMVYAPGETGGRRPGNEISSVVRVSYGEHSFLVTGDLEAKGEDDIVAAGRNVASTVLKVGHHGAKTSSTPDFIRRVQPRYAVISVGDNNRYGHPHREVLERLAAGGTRIYRTDRDGAIVFASDGVNLTVSTFAGRAIDQGGNY